MSDSFRSKADELVEGLLKNPLEFPDGAEFASIAVPLDIKQMVALCERYLPILNSQPDFVERKKREAIREPFVL
jgi:hypothetical protein